MFFGSLGTAGAQTNAAPSWQSVEWPVVLEQLRNENRDLKAQAEEREAVIRRLQESLVATRTESDLLQRQWQEAQERARTLGANPADSEAMSAQRRLVESVRQLALVEAERRQALAQLQRLLAAVQAQTNVNAEAAAAQAWLATLQRPAADAAAATGRLAAAKIVEVNAQLRVAVLDVGARQGARLGMPFWVLRGDRVVAELRVVDVRPRICGALIERVDPGVALQAGDAVCAAQTGETGSR